MELVNIEGVVGTVRLDNNELNATDKLFGWMKSGRGVPSSEGMYGNYYREFTEALNTLSRSLFAKGDSIYSSLPGRYGGLPFAEEGIQIHVSCIKYPDDDLPMFMLGRTDSKNVFKGSLIYGSYQSNIHFLDDLVRRLGELAHPKIFGMDSSTFPHPTCNWEEEVKLYGFGAIHDLGRIHQLYSLAREIYENITRYCSLTRKDAEVLFRDARLHENIVIRELSRIKYEQTISEICTSIKERMKDGTWVEIWRELKGEKKGIREGGYKQIGK